MPIRYRIDPSRALMLARAAGELTDACLLNHIARMRADPDYGPGLQQLYDFTPVTALQIGYETVRQVANTPPDHGRPVRRALVASSDEAFGLARVFEIARGGTSGETRVFKRVEEAFAWLGVEAEDLLEELA